MIRDVFYIGLKPNVHPREKPANDVRHARLLATTEHFWLINNICDYKNFDWDFDFDVLPDSEVWTQDHINIWPSDYQKDSGTWLVPKKYSQFRIYRNDVDNVPIKNLIRDNWKILQDIDYNKFDFKWHPDPTEPPYIYVFGNQWYPGYIMPTLEYHVEGAKQLKYVDNTVAFLKQDKSNFVIYDEFINFDYSWRPNPFEPPFIYVWGNQHIPGEIKPSLEYYASGASNKKYIGNVQLKIDYSKWNIVQPIDETKFDLTWRSDPREPPYIYVWGNKYIPAEIKSTIEYHVPGATDKKYMDELVEVLPEYNNWKIIQEVTNFDLSWRPDPREPAYIYVWGNKHIPAEIKPTIEYHVPGATDKKYMDELVEVLPEWDRWVEHIPVDKILSHKNGFDFSWRPDPREPAYIYVWGNQWNTAEIEPTIEYHVPGATERKYMHNAVATILPNKNDFVNLIDIESFDYSWRPNPYDPPFIYVFGNKWNEAETEPSVEYRVEGATERKYIKDIVAVPKANMECWSVVNEEDYLTFDFSWRPNPHSPPQIYQWSDNGPRYSVKKNATEVVLIERDTKYIISPIAKYYIQTTLEDLIAKHKDEVFWALNPDINYEKFDFTWKPNEENFRHINVFGNELSKNTQTYYVNAPLYHLGYKEFHYIESSSIKIETNLSMFYIDKGNKESESRFQELKIKHKNLVKTRYLNSWIETINRCAKKSKTNLFWVLSSELDYNSFTFNFYPSPWQEKMIHVFGTQWGHWGNTYLVNKETFVIESKNISLIEHLDNLNFVKSKKAKAVDRLYDVVLIDHGNTYKPTIPTTLTVKYEVNYLLTLGNIINRLPNKKEHFIWVISSLCDYDNFDFSYICDPFAKDQLHVFPSNDLQYGDTFLLNVNKFKELFSTLDNLADYDKINFNRDQEVKRLSAPIITVNYDTLTNIQNYSFNFPYAYFITNDQPHLETPKEILNLWDTKTKTITICSTGGTQLLFPKEAKQYVVDELYDYPYIATSKNIKKSAPIDIVFLSNGEKNAEENYEHLLEICKNRKNRIVRVDRINGRVNAYHAALKSSNTLWAFTIFAKLKINPTFDFDWQPDRLQFPKHYIFYATNPVNNLCYGHQALIAYNKNLVLNNLGCGLDFTLDDKHEVVPLNSGVANFNTDEYSTWRTAFREVIKLKCDKSEESKNRLEVWLKEAQGNYATYCLDGAKHAIEYFDQVNGELSLLKLSYEWDWLSNYFNKMYNV